MGICNKCCWCGINLDELDNALMHACTGEEPNATICLKVHAFGKDVCADALKRALLSLGESDTSILDTLMNNSRGDEEKHVDK